MTTSENGLKFIELNEGFSATAYNDNGKLCWGYGHDQQPGENAPESLTEEEAEALLINDLATRIEPTVNALVPPTCTQNQFDALCDFAYNLGVGSLHIMLSHGWDQAPVQIPRWDNVNNQPNQGLQARRSKEVVLFNS